MGQGVNMKTIAELAGVSVATVSRVINQNGRFSAETEANVRRVMRELHFHPNTVAKSLKENRSNMVGVIVPDITNPHFAKMVLEIEKKLFDDSYVTIICNTNESRTLEQRYMDALISMRVSGIVLISGNRTYDLNGIPVIYVERCSSVGQSGSQVAERTVARLLAMMENAPIDLLRSDSADRLVERDPAKAVR